MRFLDKLEEALLMIGLSLMGLSVALQIFMRYLFNMPLVWSEEFARYIFVWITFIGAGYGVRHGIHISMEYFYNKFPPAVRKAVSIATLALSAGAFAYLLPTAVFFMAEQDKIASSAMQMPMSWLFAAVPVGCVLVLIHLAADAVALFRGSEGGGK
jgi:TRAP-type C4-dicarboxylate transport system permease small subunit